MTANPNPWRRSAQPLVIAHQGHSIAFPGNTMPAYRAAIELGAEMIEADVQRTCDNHLVMLHDGTLDRTSNGTGPIRDATWDEVRALDAGSWKGAEFRGTRIPTAEDLLDLAREAGIPLCLEVKAPDDPEAIAIADALVTLLIKKDALGWAFVSSYHHPALAHARRRVADVLVAPERLPDDLPADPPECLRQARALEAPAIQHRHSLLTAEVIATLHDADIAVWAWTPNLEDEIRACAKLGADGIMSDDVVALRAAVDRPRRRGAGR
ncbi:MAG TPA: glycerophosphodiester phosphodiesterase family protein [Chloroflexota bacterium]|nr:glycerophosphodiester phosphodiesterase family protein [Chloroflexota bacterium]